MSDVIQKTNDLINNDISAEDYIEVNRRAYDQLSDEYIKRSLIVSDFETPAGYLVESALQYTKRNKELSVLEVGPGSGKAIQYFETLRCRTTAVDLSGKIIELAKINSPSTIFIHANILELNFLPCQFDVIFAGALIHLFPKFDAIKLIKKFCIWIKKDGVLFISTTINDKSEEGFSIKSDYENSVKRFRKKWTETEFRDLISEYFTILNTIYTDEKDRNKIWVGHICKPL
ncbi:MAG TPA: class I SAM-dependent methyltransferase [Mucilaginibacter sp.]|jgi:SAM-dependent methyltransferase